MFSKLFNKIKYNFHFKFKRPHKWKEKELKPLAVNRGGCLATDRITVDGQKVGWMYREKPSNKLDNGWRFFSGNESREYINNLIHTHPYDTNTIANIDPEIVPYLDSPFNSAFERNPKTNKFNKLHNYFPKSNKE